MHGMSNVQAVVGLIFQVFAGESSFHIDTQDMDRAVLTCRCKASGLSIHYKFKCKRIECPEAFLQVQMLHPALAVAKELQEQVDYLATLVRLHDPGFQYDDYLKERCRLVSQSTSLAADVATLLTATPSIYEAVQRLPPTYWPDPTLYLDNDSDDLTQDDDVPDTQLTTMPLCSSPPVSSQLFHHGLSQQIPSSPPLAPLSQEDVPVESPRPTFKIPRAWQSIPTARPRDLKRKKLLG
jgi:hypothetical protein